MPKHTITVVFSPEQYERLMKLAYCGNWLINSHRDNPLKPYEEIEQIILRKAKDAGLTKYLDPDEVDGEIFTNRAFEEETDIQRFIEEYDDETFWQELIDRLARRDVIAEHGLPLIEKMGWRERAEKEHPFIQKYEKEFSEHGLDHIHLDHAADIKREDTPVSQPSVEPLTQQQILEKRQEIEHELGKLLKETGSEFSLKDIKEIIYNEEGTDDPTQIIAMFDTGQGAAALENIMDTVNDAWNYFPHKVLGELAPAEKLREHRQHGKG